MRVRIELVRVDSKEVLYSKVEEISSTKTLLKKVNKIVRTIETKEYPIEVRTTYL